MKGIIRPEPVILSDESAIPARNRILPVPNQFTHELTRRQPFYFSSAQQGSTPDGELQAGSKVVLLSHDGGSFCRVVSEEGLYVEIESSAMRKL